MGVSGGSSLRMKGAIKLPCAANNASQMLAMPPCGSPDGPSKRRGTAPIGLVSRRTVWCILRRARRILRVLDEFERSANEAIGVGVSVDAWRRTFVDLRAIELVNLRQVGVRKHQSAAGHANGN